MTYYARELTDPAGGALTITTDHQGLWITATEGREEVTVGPFPATTFVDDMDGGVTAALIEKEVAGSYTRTTEQPRPLTPDAITDEMVERGAQAATRAGVRYLRPPEVREVLTAALTEPPARPEGAEELAQLIATADVGEWDCGDLADALLATGRVRVVTEEQP